MTRTGIFLFDDVEALDFAGPYEVFTTANRVAKKLNLTPSPPFDVFSVAASADPVRVRAGMRIIPEFSFDNTPDIDLLIVPGGVVTAEMEKPSVIHWITQTAGRAGMVASVCTGVFLLAKAGVVTRHRVTTHWEDVADLRAHYPALQVQENSRWVDEGSIVTSAGISAGIDMSLHLTERLAGRSLAVATARQMDYDWQEI